MEQCVPREDDDVSIEDIERELERVCGSDTGKVPAKMDPLQFKPIPSKMEPIRADPVPMARVSHFDKRRLEVAQQRTTAPQATVTKTQAKPRARNVTSEMHFPTTSAMVAGEVHQATPVTEHTTPLHVHSHPVDNSRQMAAMAATDEMISVSTPVYARSGIIGMIQNLLGMHPAPEKITETRRVARKRVSVNDPRLTPREKLVAQLWVTDTWDELVSKQVTANELFMACVHFDEILAEGAGLVDFCQIHGTFDDAVNMGFQAKHMVKDRVKSGPAVLARDFGVDFNTMCKRTGLTIDSAVYEYGMNLSDFKLLAPSLENLMWHGLVDKHVEHMRVKRSQIVDAFPGANEADLAKLFPNDRAEAVRSTPSNTTAAAPGLGAKPRPPRDPKAIVF
jgi:hypothetical protein